MFKKEKPKPEKKSEKLIKIIKAGEEFRGKGVIKPTPFAKKAGIHKDTFTDSMDVYDSLKDLGIINFRDENGELVGTIISDEYKNTINLLREIRKEQLNQNTEMDKLKKEILEIKRILEGMR